MILQEKPKNLTAEHTKNAENRTKRLFFFPLLLLSLWFFLPYFSIWLIIIHFCYC